jgi:hypothetical protein
VTSLTCITEISRDAKQQLNWLSQNFHLIFVKSLPLIVLLSEKCLKNIIVAKLGMLSYGTWAHCTEWHGYQQTCGDEYEW